MTNKRNKRYVVALDQGTTSSRAIVFGRDVNVISQAQREFTQFYPQTGWVRHDPMEVWATQNSTLVEALTQVSIEHDQVAAIGVTNQHETTVVWDRHSGRPIHDAIVWQCQHSAAICAQPKRDGLEDYIREITGLVTGPYFSGTKLKWILGNVEGAREHARNGDLLFGTIDTWLIWKLTEGKVRVTDYTSALRTILFNIHSLGWDTRMLEVLDIPRSVLPEVRDSSEVYDSARIGGVDGGELPIAGIAGDQQVTLFNQMCVEPGQAKDTYGISCFLLIHTGGKAVRSTHGLLTTIACGPHDEVGYVLGDAVFSDDSTVQWLRDKLKMINNSFDSEYFAAKVKDSNGVCLVPAFTGLGAPYWDPYARGAVFGLTRGIKADRLIRTTLESIAYQIRDVLDTMQHDAGECLRVLRVDSGAVANNFLIQFQADILDTRMERPMMRETTALGAAYPAGLTCGFWSGLGELKSKAVVERVFEPEHDEPRREKLYAGWRKAVERTHGWDDGEL